MKLPVEKGLTAVEYRKQVEDMILKSYNIPDYQREEALSWHIIRRDIAEHMQEALKGRPVPVKKYKGAVNSEAKRMLWEHQEPTYPKYCKTDRQKFEYLLKIREERRVPQEIFLELSQVLKVKLKSEHVERFIEFL